LTNYHHMSPVSKPSISSRRRKVQSLLKPPTLITVLNPKTRKPFALEYSIHASPARFTRELKDVFPEVVCLKEGRCLVVPAFQRCEHDLVGAVNRERDEKLEDFVQWGMEVCQKLRDRGHWADITDPASGYPIFSKPGPSPYPDVQGAEQLLKYDVQNAGCCKVLLHPRWGSKAYPSTLFTNADEGALEEVVNESVIVVMSG